ncbi:hypothetical protein CICLE_v10004563mg [Citrus x clementina]|uniref:Cyclic nucleotide-binding domain-containing protein n=1 Tax=Citrus clementina TaxID=85681 RepID=V4S986_CITCL|nr:hypothetical protein CICLE_v10004563mg [Citrus x clementina]
MSQDPEKGSKHEQPEVHCNGTNSADKKRTTCFRWAKKFLGIILLCAALLCLPAYSGVMLVACLLIIIIIIIVLYRKAIAAAIENKRYLLLNVIAMILDPFFFYIPDLKDEIKCIRCNDTLGITATVIRSILDFLKLLHISSELREADKKENQRKKFKHLWQQLKNFKKGGREVLEDPMVRMWMLFFIDGLAILPIPQVLVIFPIRDTGFSTAMTFFVLQYLLRVIRTYFLFTDAIEVSGVIADATWGIFAFYVLLYLQSGHMFGALWYYYAIEKATDCWREASENHTGRSHSYVFCNKCFGDYKLLNDSCPISTGNTTRYNFGIYKDALQSGIVRETYFPKKLLRCLHWGLQKLSAFGQDLETSDDVGENIFAIWMTIYGVVLFVFLIGRMQSETTRAHKINQKLRQIKHWKHFKDISTFVRAKIREAKRENLLLKHDIHIDSLVSDLPDDTAKQVKLHFGRNLLGQMQKFENWEDYSLDHLCGCLKPVFFSERTTIISEGESIHEMLFVLEGQISIYSKFKLIGLKRQEDGNYCGEEIIDWAENQSSSHGHLPISTRTIIAHTNIEGFTLKADDLKQGVALHRRFDQLVRSVQSSWRSKKSKQMQMKRRQSRSHE